MQNALDLATEVGVARGIDDVDAGALPEDRRGLGQDGDAPFALQIVGIHRPLDHALVLAVGAGLLQQAVDQGGLAVVDVRDDGDVAEIHAEALKNQARAAMGPPFAANIVTKSKDAIASWPLAAPGGALAVTKNTQKPMR